MVITAEYSELTAPCSLRTFTGQISRYLPAGTQVCSIETGQAICADVACTGWGEPAAVCTVTPDTLDFATVVIGNNSDQTFVIKNTGGDLLTGGWLVTMVERLS